LRRAFPNAFTEQGVAMLSSVLRSRRAVPVNVAIMRGFVNLRRMLATNKTLARKLAELERRVEGHDRAVESLFVQDGDSHRDPRDSPFPKSAADVINGSQQRNHLEPMRKLLYGGPPRASGQ
jgi:hypothetical protein